MRCGARLICAIDFGCCLDFAFGRRREASLLYIPLDAAVILMGSKRAVESLKRFYSRCSLV